MLLRVFDIGLRCGFGCYLFHDRLKTSNSSTIFISLFWSG
uniref:Uncharacterized protein n=1 Tax=Rhizophora mucronata TaxID=61149 RepID=A0A2P2IY55_RHIMU